MTPTELKHAASVMARAADGEMVEYKTVDPHSTWRACSGIDAAWDWRTRIYRILSFPPPPENCAWHNPAGLTATQVGVHEGWRCLLDCEWPLVPHDGQYFDVSWQHPRASGWPVSANHTYRTKAPLPAPKVDAFTEAWMKYAGIGHSNEKWRDFTAGWNAAKAHFTKQP